MKIKSLHTPDFYPLTSKHYIIVLKRFKKDWIAKCYPVPYGSVGVPQ